RRAGRGHGRAGGGHGHGRPHDQRDPRGLRIRPCPARVPGPGLRRVPVRTGGSAARHPARSGGGVGMRIIRWRRSTFVAAALLAPTVLSAEAVTPLGPFAVRVEAGVRVPMRDGVKLVADVYRPEDAGRYPVLLQRTPYNRHDPATGVRLASHGYVVVFQDTRGRYDSEGEFYPFRHEAHDGYDTVEWAAALPYADGKVGMF